MQALDPLPSIPANDKTAVNSSSSTSVAATLAIILSRIPNLNVHEASLLDICTKSSRWLEFIDKSSDFESYDNKLYTGLVYAATQVRETLMTVKQQRKMMKEITFVKKKALDCSKLPRLDYKQIHSIYFDDYAMGYQKSILSEVIAIQAFEAFVFYSNGYAHLKSCRVCVRCGKSDKMSHCKRCRLATYCSRECQVEDWRDPTRPHVELCNQLSYSYQYIALKNGSFYLQPVLHGCRIFSTD